VSSPSLLELLGRVARLCDDCDVPYMVMGGVAVAVHAIPRPTLDVDLTIRADEACLLAFLESASENGFLVPDHYRFGFTDSLKGMHKLQLSCFVDEIEHDVDLFLVTTDYQAAAFERRIRATLASHDIWVISAEDLVLHKLLTGRGRDESDVDDVLFLQGPFDLEYMRRWAEVLEVLPVLERKLTRLDTEPDPSP
jgi:hypothetical protein